MGEEGGKEVERGEGKGGEKGEVREEEGIGGEGTRTPLTHVCLRGCKIMNQPNRLNPRLLKILSISALCNITTVLSRL